MNPRVLQMLLPFMKTLAKSPKSEQTWRMMEDLGSLVGRGAKAEEQLPWDKLKSLVQDFRHPNLEILKPRREERLDFNLQKPGGSEWRGQVSPRERNPYELYVDNLHSDATRRRGVGGFDDSLGEYKMDISSPAQREWPWGPINYKRPGDPHRTAMRTAEDRVPLSEFRDMQKLGHYQPGPSSREKQEAMDRLLELARGAGFKDLKFAAEPGERPLLYEKLMGFKAEPTGAGPLDVMSNLMEGFPARQGGSQSRPSLLSRAGAQMPDLPMHVNQVENALGLSIQEAEHFGFAKPHPNVQGLFHLTDEGRRMAADWGSRQ